MKGFYENDNKPSGSTEKGNFWVGLVAVAEGNLNVMELVSV